MTKVEIISLVVTIVSLLCFSCVFTVLFSSYCKTSSEEVISGKKDIELLDTVLIEKKAAEKKKKKQNKVLTIIKKIVSYFVLGILAITLCSSIYSKVTNDMTPIFDTAVLTIKTGSMSKKHESNDYLYTYNLNDQFNAYDMIFVHEIKDVNDLQIYDVIAYRNETNTIIIHRIVEIFEEDGVIKFRTRGDANEPVDAHVSTYEDIVGIYKGERIPVMGIFILFLQSYSGLVTIIAVIYCVWMFNKQYGKFKKHCDERLDILLSLIIDPEDVTELKTSYIQYIYYRGNIYEFNDGKFVRKGKEALTGDQNIYFVSNENENIKVEAKNVDENIVVELSEQDELKTLSDIKHKIEE